MLDHKQLIKSHFKSAKQSLITIRDIIRFAVSLFNENKLYFGHGTTNAFDEAVYLILHQLNLPLDQLEPYFDAKLLPEELNKILAILEKRIVDRIPSAYLTNEAFLQNYSFYIDPRAIIPRSFIAEIILNDELSPYIEHPELVHNVLDLCTGNGSLAIIAADYFYDSEVIAVDLDENALAVAQINIKKYGFENRIKTIQSNLWANLGQQQFDLIISNPPYVDKKRMQSLPPEYLHEPKIALDGGDNGLFLIDEILQNAKNYLTDHGLLIIEMGDNREEIEEKYPDLPFNWLETESGDGFIFTLTKSDLNS